MEKYTIILFYVLLIIPLLSSAASNDCTTSYCNDRSFVGVRFPFRLINQQPENCGFPGFNLGCYFSNMILIHLPKSGDFAVRSIDYLNQAIRIYDPFNCLPARLSTFDLSDSPFSTSYVRNYTLLSCPSGAPLSGFKPIECLSNSTFSILATNSESVVASLTSIQIGCMVSGNLIVPVANQTNQDVFLSQLDDVTLTWGAPNCERCESFGLSCGYADSNSQKTTCFSNIGAASPKVSNVFRIIAFAMAIPAIAASLMIACFMCTKDRNNNELTRNRRTTITSITPIDAVPSTNIVGLDQTTIESYTKVVLGESKRLPGHEDAMCPICLSEYHVKETVRCIPECLHCFHAECIDEWLKMNGTCPICRNSPSPNHVES